MAWSTQHDEEIVQLLSGRTVQLGSQVESQLIGPR